MGQVVARLQKDPFDGVEAHIEDGDEAGPEECAKELGGDTVRVFPWSRRETQKDDTVVDVVARLVRHEQCREAILAQLMVVGSALHDAGLPQSRVGEGQGSVAAQGTTHVATGVALAFHGSFVFVFHMVETFLLRTFGALVQDSELRHAWFQVLATALKVYAEQGRIPDWLACRHVRCVFRYMASEDSFLDAQTSISLVRVLMASGQTLGEFEGCKARFCALSAAASLGMSWSEWVSCVIQQAGAKEELKSTLARVLHETVCEGVVEAEGEAERERVQVGGTDEASVQTRLRFESRIQMLRDAFHAMWETLPVTPPQSMQRYSLSERMKRLGKCRKLKGIATGKLEPLQKKKEANREIAALMMGTKRTFLGDVLDKGLFKATTDFTAAARAYDTSLPNAELFQASRNAWTAFAIQLVYFPEHVGFNTAVQGYSMLYPYSDNYLDDPQLNASQKKTFLVAFREWLAGERRQAPANEQEQKVLDQVTFIEQHYARQDYLDAFNSLVAILDAQAASLTQHTREGEPVPSDDHIIDVTVFKGGTSVLADAYMDYAQGVRNEIEFFSFAFGVALQLVDDIQDVITDRRNDQHTIFTLNLVRREASDASICKLLHMLERTLHPSFALDPDAISSSTRELRVEILNMTYSMVLKSVAKSQVLFTPPFLKTMERFAPLPFSSLVKVNSMRHLLYLVDNNLV
eukprot:m.107024 g.107024  ORF g.107024 m.107024 type:complete len:693 (+) comp13315_c0_seq8:182-2260(+)